MRSEREISKKLKNIADEQSRYYQFHLDALSNKNMDAAELYLRAVRECSYKIDSLNWVLGFLERL